MVYRDSETKSLRFTHPKNCNVRAHDRKLWSLYLEFENKNYIYFNMLTGHILLLLCVLYFALQ